MTAPAPLWRIASTGLCERPERRLLPYHAIALCLGLGVLVSGCAGASPAPLAPVVMGAAICPEPATPSLPSLDGANTFDAPAAWATLMERDDTLRAYIAALRRTVACYAAQTANPVD